MVFNYICDGSPPRLFGRLIPNARRPGQGQYRASMYHPVDIVSPCNPDRYMRRQVHVLCHLM